MGSELDNGNQRYQSKGLKMNQTQNQGWLAEMQLILKRQKANDNFCNAYVRLPAPERRNVLRLLRRLAYRKTGTNSYWDRWTTDDMRACYLKLQPISQKLANGWRRWASPHLKAGLNYRLAMIVLVDSMVCQMWIEADSETQ
jgi:cellobiose phosphorylase